MGIPDLALAIGEAARALPPAHTHALAELLDRCPAPSTAAGARLLDLVPAPHYRQVARRLLTAWMAQPETPGAAVALALRAASGTAAAVRAEQSTEIVWTGPITNEVPVRLTSQVLLDVIALAQRRILVVSFAAYRVTAIAEALAMAAARGVRIDLILETAVASGGRLTVDAASAFTAVAQAATFYAWPLDRRPARSSGHASMHAKAAIADGAAALVTSANFTGSAIDANMELGLLIRGGPVPRRLANHFQQLIDDGILERVPPPDSQATHP